MQSSEVKKQRQLAAILFADIQGFTGLMEHDEANASRLLAKFRNELKHSVSTKNGRIVNFYGDGCLAIFSNPFQAIEAAISVQEAFLSQPVVPVRIGLHSGSVVLEEDNVYGDSINQASRLESMATAGSILMSESFRNEIRTKSDIDTIFLGSFEFKNVEQPVGIHALQRKGFTVPEPSQIEGKLKPAHKDTVKVKWYFPVIILLLGLLIVKQFWPQEPEEIINLGTATVTPASNELLSDQRVAVMIFENRTTNQDFDSYGRTISDSLTEKLSKTEKVNMVSVPDFQGGLIDAENPNPLVLDQVGSFGVDVILSGQYYEQEDHLIIQGNLLDVQNRNIIHVFDPVQGARNDTIEILDLFTEQILNFWSVEE